MMVQFLVKLKYLVRQFPFFMPGGIISSCEQWIIEQRKRKGSYFDTRGPWYKTIFEKGFVSHSQPNAVGKINNLAFNRNVNYPTLKSTLFYLQNCYVFGDKGMILTSNNRLFQEFTHNFLLSTIKKFLWRNPFYTFSFNAKKIDGTGAVLVSPESHNYYHWLNDVLPRIKLYESVFDQIDFFCVSASVPSKFIDTLSNFGIESNKVILIKPFEKLHFDHLYVASLPGSEGRSPSWAVPYVRSKLIKNEAVKKITKRIYFKRGDNAERKILNETEIINLLSGYKFDIIDAGDFTVKEQMELMQDVQIVIGAHGAALSNLIFIPQQSAVIEIFSPEYLRTDCYYTLSSFLQLNYWYIIGDKPVNSNWGDIVVPINALQTILNKLDIA